MNSIGQRRDGIWPMPHPCLFVAHGVVLTFLAIAPGALAAPVIEPLWVADANMAMESAPFALDLDGDGDAEIVTAAYENLIALDGDGSELWRFDTRGRYMTYVAALERPSAPPLLYAGDNTGQFTCVDGAGQVTWQAETAPISASAPLVVDLDGDGAPEVVQGDTSGALTVFDALTGRVVWKRQVEGRCASPAAGDLDGDEKPDIAISTGAGKVFAVDCSGETLWTYDLGAPSEDWATCSPVLFGDSKGETRLAVGSSRQRLFCLDARGAVLWDRSTRGATASTISVGDFDDDGRADLFVVTQLGVLYRFDESGVVLWEIDTQGRSLAPGAIVELDGDGMLEYVLCTQNGNMLVFDELGAIVFRHQFDNRTVNVTPAFGDIVKERPGMEFAVTGGESGRMFCFGTSAPVGARAPWSTYRADNRLTGAWFGLVESDNPHMIPENLDGARLCSGDVVRFHVTSLPVGRDSFPPLVAASAGMNQTGTNPALRRFEAQAVCLRPDGSRQAAIGKAIGKSGVLELPVTIPESGPYRFSWALSDETGNVLANGARELTLEPYRNDRALAARAMLALRAAAGGDSVDSAEGIRVTLLREASEIERSSRELADRQTAAQGSQPAFRETVDADTSALDVRARRDLVLADVGRAILEIAPNTPLAVFEGTMWENRAIDTQLPDAVAFPLRIERRCVTGEHEPFSIKLFNVTLEPLPVRGLTSADADGMEVTLYEVKPVPTNQGTMAWDPMVPLGGGPLTIPPLETREVWVDVDTAQARPGKHAVRIAFSTENFEASVEAAIDVAPFAMASFGALRLCCWASYNEDAVRDLLAHGNNVFIASVPPASVAGDPLKVEPDFAALEAFVAPLAGHDVFLLLSGIPSLGTSPDDSGYPPRLGQYLDRLMSHLAKLGIDEQHVAFYPYDEPGGYGWDTVNGFVAFARSARKAHPGIQFYVNGGGDLPMFQAFDEIASIWCPGFYMLSEDTPVMAFLRGTGKPLWTYDCGYAFARPIGANTKTTNVAAQYRLAPLFAVRFGADGIGFWSYNIGDPMWNAVPSEYPIVYVNPDGTQTICRRWEAIREGMEDARILLALRERLQDKTLPAETVARIRHLFDDTLANEADQAFGEAHLGMARYVLDASHNDAGVMRLRNHMMDCIEALAQSAGAE